MLLRDEALAAQIRQAVTNAQNATVELNHAAIDASSIVSDVQSRSFPEKIHETLASVNDTVSNLDATSKQVRQTLADFTGPDEKGVTAAENLRESLSSVNTATANMADDTEAVKHNFFLRGFFRCAVFQPGPPFPGPLPEGPSFFGPRQSPRVASRGRIVSAHCGGC